MVSHHLPQPNHQFLDKAKSADVTWWLILEIYNRVSRMRRRRRRMMMMLMMMMVMMMMLMMMMMMMMMSRIPNSLHDQ